MLRNICWRALLLNIRGKSLVEAVISPRLVHTEIPGAIWPWFQAQEMFVDKADYKKIG